MINPKDFPAGKSSDLVVQSENHPTTTSLIVAEKFGKAHKNVLQSIDRLECSRGFTELNFQPSEYVDSTGRKLPMFKITRDGFVFLATGFTGKRAAAWKEEFISAFNAMERELIERRVEQRTADAMARRVDRQRDESCVWPIRYRKSHEYMLDYSDDQGAELTLLCSVEKFRFTIRGKIGKASPEIRQKYEAAVSVIDDLLRYAENQ